MVSVLRDLVGYRTDRVALRAIILLCLLVALFWINPEALEPPPTNLADGHAVQAIELAMTQAFCGEPSSFPNRYRVPHFIRDHPAENAKPLRDVIGQLAGSVDAYCRAVDQPFINNENSLSLLMSGLLWLEPDLSMDGLGRRLHIIRLGAVVLFSIVCLACGASVLVSAGIVGLGVGVLRLMSELTHSLYPFLFPSLLSFVALLALGSGRLGIGSLRHAIGLGFAIGLLAGFGINLRTSYLPVYAALVGTALAFAWRRWAMAHLPRFAILKRVGALLAAGVSSAWLFQFWYIDRHLPADVKYNSSYHTVAHPLVLSLAIPESDLSRREGIRWADASGVEIAQRIDPTATYLGPTYDAALFRYYRGLWRDHQREMLALYYAKFKLAGVSIINALRSNQGIDGTVWRWLLLPVANVQNGILLLVLCVAIAVAALFASRTPPSQLAMILAMLSVAAALLLAESAIIMPVFTPQYHGYLAMYFPMMSLFGLQGLAQLASSVALQRPPRGTVARKTPQYFDSISDDFGSRMNPFDLEARSDWFAAAFERFPPGQRVLDVGSGLGHFADLARARGAEVVPLDIAPRLVTKLKANYPRAICGSATALPFPDAAFDAVISSECIEHTPDPRRSVAEMIRVLKPGGRLYLTTPNLVWRWSVWLAERLGVRNFEGVENWLSRRALGRAIVASGATIEASEGLHILPFQARPLWPFIAWMNVHGQWGRAAMINQCWVARKA